MGHSGFSVVKDGWVDLSKTDSVEWALPDNVALDSQAILQFMLALKHAEGANVRILMNGSEIWTWEFREGNRYMSIHEVIRGDTLQKGVNVLTIEVPSGNYEFLQLSDIVVWWQATD